MNALIEVILPVFLVIGFGFFAVWRGFFSEAGVDGLMVFTQKFAIPCLLFRAISTLDLEQSFDLDLMISFYAGALCGFLVCFLGARFLFNRLRTLETAEKNVNGRIHKRCVSSRVSQLNSKKLINEIASRRRDGLRPGKAAGK